LRKFHDVGPPRPVLRPGSTAAAQPPVTNTGATCGCARDMISRQGWWTPAGLIAAVGLASRGCWSNAPARLPGRSVVLALPGTRPNERTTDPQLGGLRHHLGNARISARRRTGRGQARWGGRPIRAKTYGSDLHAMSGVWPDAGPHRRSGKELRGSIGQGRAYCTQSEPPR